MSFNLMTLMVTFFLVFHWYSLQPMEKMTLTPIQKPHPYHIYFHKQIKLDRALVYFLVNTFKISLISFHNKMWYFPMWTIPMVENTNYHSHC
jgi:hypothetical protein